MTVDFIRHTWQDWPSTETPITADELNRLEEGIAGLYSDLDGIDLENIEETVEDLEEAVENFKAGVELTQEEYDNLTEEEKNNGTVYYITDAPSTPAISALDASYNNSTSGLQATNVQGAVDEVQGEIDELNSNISNIIVALACFENNRVNSTLAVHNGSGSIGETGTSSITGDLLVVEGRVRVYNFTRSSANPGFTLTIPNNRKLKYDVARNIGGTASGSAQNRSNENLSVSGSAGGSTLLFTTSETFSNLANQDLVFVFAPVVFLLEPVS